MAKRIKFSEKFLNEYERNIKTSTKLNYNDETLFHIFKNFKESICENLDGCYQYDKENTGFHFHKSFRQTDVIPKLYNRQVISTKPIKFGFAQVEELSIDIIIWNLLQNSPVFWETITEMTQTKKTA